MKFFEKIKGMINKDLTNEVADFVILTNQLKDSYNTHVAGQVCTLCCEIGKQHNNQEECEIAKVIES